MYGILRGKRVAELSLPLLLLGKTEMLHFAHSVSNMVIEHCVPMLK